jgi:hypothetical protein
VTVLATVIAAVLAAAIAYPLGRAHTTRSVEATEPAPAPGADTTATPALGVPDDQAVDERATTKAGI